MQNEKFYLLALQQIQGIGCVLSRKLIAHFGSAQAVFEAKSQDFLAIEGFDKVRAEAFKKPIDEKLIEKEFKFMQKHDVQMHSFTDATFPKHLLEIPDAPYLLFSKGIINLNAKRQIAIVGTRNNSAIGKQFVEELVKELAPYNPCIVSGLAYGIDIIAHRAALDNGLSTIGVLAHGLDQIYPPDHKGTVSEMLEKGGVLSEYTSGTNPDKPNFPSRNRIVAGMTKATIVVESGVKGGSMITAKLALSYDRDVFAMPGRYKDSKSEGCHYLIKTNIAQLITSAKDIVEYLNWDEQEKKVAKQMQAKLFQTFSPEEQILFDLIAEKELIHIDELQIKSGMSSSSIAALLLQLEFEQVINSMPGKRYKINS